MARRFSKVQESILLRLTSRWQDFTGSPHGLLGLWLIEIRPPIGDEQSPKARLTVGGLAAQLNIRLNKKRDQIDMDANDAQNAHAKMNQHLAEQLSDEQKAAMVLMQSTRGQFIISQALCLAVDVLREREQVDPESIGDMLKLLALFPMYETVRKAAAAVADDDWLTDGAGKSS